MTRRFAEDTAVPVIKTQGEIKALLKRAGADGVAIFEGPERHTLGFQLASRQYRMAVPVDRKARNAAQEERRAWRLLGLIIKSKLEAVREGASTIEREFLADTVMPDGGTMYEHVKEPLRLAYETGKMPQNGVLLLGGR